MLRDREDDRVGPGVRETVQDVDALRRCAVTEIPVEPHVVDDFLIPVVRASAEFRVRTDDDGAIFTSIGKYFHRWRWYIR